MEKAAEALKKLTATLEKYRKNKTMVKPEDLAGKYKAPFEKLKAQLKDELSEYLTIYSLEGLPLIQDNEGRYEEFEAAADQILKSPELGRQAGKAVFQEYDLDKVKKYAEDLRTRIYNEAWLPYFERHTCLYTTKECFAAENPQSPRIYNSLVDKFYQEETGEWKADPAAGKPVVLIYIQRKEKKA